MAKIERPFGPNDDAPPPGSPDDYGGLNGDDGPEHVNGKANGHAANGSAARAGGPFEGLAKADSYRHMMHEAIVPLPVLVADLIPGECAGILSGAGGGGKGILY